VHYRLNNLFVLRFLGGLYRRKEVWVKNTVALIAGVAVAFCAWGQPQAPVRALFVPYETPTSFYLWDPEEAQALGYAFKIVEPPRSGRLLGEPPALTYVPNPKFYGTDRLQYLVEDPLGRFDIGVIQIVVLPVVTLLETPVVPPNVSLVATLDFSGMPVEVKLSRWEVGYFQRLGFLEQELRASWGPTGFSSLSSGTRLDLVIPGDPALRIPVISTLSFDPNLPALASASVQSWANLWGIFAFALVNYLGTDPTKSKALLTLRTSLGDLSVEGRSTWKIIPLEFSELAVRLAGPGAGAALGCPACTFRFEGTATFAKDEGLKELRLSLLDLPLCSLCERMRLVWDLRVKFTPTSKTVEPALRLKADWGVCVRPFVELIGLSPGWGFGGLSVYGVEIKCELPNGGGLRLATSFAEDKNASVTGHTQFFEVWQVHGPVFPCCGAQGRWQISTFFRRAGGGIFGWAMSEFQLYFPVSQEVVVRMIAKFGEVDPADPGKTWALTLGFTGLW